MDSLFFLFLGYEFPDDENETLSSELTGSVQTSHQEIVAKKLLPPFLVGYTKALEDTNEHVKEALELLRKGWNKGTFLLYQVDGPNGIVEIFSLNSSGEMEVEVPFDARLEVIRIRGAELAIPNADPVLTIKHDLTPLLGS